MVFPVVLYKLAQLVLYQALAESCYKAATKMSYCVFLLKNLINLLSSTPSPHHHKFPSVYKCDFANRGFDTLVCDIDGALLRSDNCYSFFPYFMLVAFEAGSIIRSFFLLCSCSFLWVLDYEQQIKVMTFISFCGLRTKAVQNVGRAVLPKFFLENINLQAEVWVSTGSRVVFTSFPRVMIEGFAREYLGVNCVIAAELQSIGGKYYTGLVLKHRAPKECLGEKVPELGIENTNYHDHYFLSLRKLMQENGLNNEDTKPNSSATLPRDRYPKPLIFHDGRLAFLPTPLATLFMFMWIPLGFPLAILRLCVGILLPYKMALFIGGWTGIRIIFKNHNFSSLNPNRDPSNGVKRKGVLYVCNHRTLLDPVFLSVSLGKPLTAVTYSLSKMSELIAPIKTVRLTRDRERDGAMMKSLLSQGDLVVCPEGTTCREPYLLRFSPLFAELAEKIVPVAVDAKVDMFYGTTASGLKCLDPIFFLMNPRPVYSLEVLEQLPEELNCRGGGKNSVEVANYIQKQLASSLGFECTNLTRKDKYLMLAGNEGRVKQ